MKNPFITRYRIIKDFLGPFHVVEFKKWWQYEWYVHGMYCAKEYAVNEYKKLTGHDPD